MNLAEREFLALNDNLRIILLRDEGCSLQNGKTLVDVVDMESAEADETGMIQLDPSGKRKETRQQVQAEVDLQQVPLVPSSCG
jgi:hypothetical protein